MKNKATMLSYEQLMLRHMDRISMLSCYIAPEQLVSSGGGYMQIDYEKMKENSFSWAALIFRAFVPDTLMDNKFNETKKDSKVGEMKMQDNVKLIMDLVNLLNRKGLLIQKKAIGDVSQHGDTSQEVWEDI